MITVNIEIVKMNIVIIEVIQTLHCLKCFFGCVISHSYNVLDHNASPRSHYKL